MHFVVVRCAGLALFGCCTVSQALAQEQAPETGAPSAEGASRPIDILDYRIEGNTVLPRTAVEEAVLPFMGPKRPASDVEAARAALEKAYRAAGYETVAVELPEQDVRGGVIHLNVVELKVGRLRVEGARFHSPEDIKDKVPALTEGVVPNYRQVSDQIATLNRAGGGLVSPSLRAGETPDTVDVDLQVDDEKPFHGSLELNDRSSSRTDRLRVSASVRYGNLFQLGHSLSLQGQFAPTDPGQSWALSGSYVAPIGDKGFSVLGYAVHSKSDVAALGGIGVLGSGDIVGLRGLYSFLTGPQDRPIVNQLILGLDYKNFKESLILGADTAATPIDYVPLTAQYSMSQHTDAYDLDTTIGLNLGLRGLGANDIDFRLKRYNASASWVAVRGDLNFTYKLPGDWRAGVRLSGQIAGGPLISNEQFSAGGLDSVRGYFESQELGDDGASGQFQIDGPSLFAGDRYLKEFRLFAFADGAVLRVRDPLSSQDPRTRIFSLGGGFNYRFLDHINGSALLAAPLRAKGDAPTDIGDSLRVQIRLWSDF